MSAAMVFEAAPTDPRDRLDKLVVKLLERAGQPASRAEVQRWIEHGRVLIDGAPGRVAAKVAAGAQVAIEPEPPEATTASSTRTRTSSSSTSPRASSCTPRAATRRARS
jgi:23S rRNA-/tRNA-specific pseudouridylate synthase